MPDFIKTVAIPILKLKGDDLPVSSFSPDGFIPVGTTAYEKRSVATFVPQWDVDKCVECCQCSIVCAHAAIRPYLANDDELKNAPESYKTKKTNGDLEKTNLNFRIQLYPEDCLGCESCVNVCPVQALSLKPLKEELLLQKQNLEFAQSNISKIGRASCRERVSSPV